MWNRFRENLFTNILIAFIIVQPILDILTFFYIRNFDSSITIGLVSRVLFMLFAVLFIFFGNKSTLKKYVVPYLIGLFIVIGMGLVYNFFAKPIFSPFSELQLIAKTVYFSINFCAYLLIFDSMSKVQATKLKILKAVTIAMLIVSFSMFIAIITGTAERTYDYVKFGFKGWFHAGNEISAIVAICFPLVYIYALRNTPTLKKIYNFIPVILLSIISILIGTKVGHFAVFLVSFIIAANYLIIWIIKSIKKSKDPTFKTRFIAAVSFFIFFLLITPLSPSFANVANDYIQLKEEASTPANDTQEEESPIEDNNEELDPDESEDPLSGEDKEKKKSNRVTIDSEILNIILSSRNIYFTDMYNDYLKADLYQKLFGMGYAGNYEEKAKLIEMDFFDLFFSFGIIGFIIILLPLLITIFLVLKRLVKTPALVFTPENLLLLSSMALGFGIAFLAGHVMFAPAVSIYLSIVLTLFIVSWSNQDSRTI
ncbi:O-antigen ligase family protein [Pontibacillus salipaludis]|uniref:Membrane protein n=1 Tax=Pontibacillus salipaludis TaxID=1697394 RepID=A0ABQ1QI25_9BACI|nr:O-antigen ligase family protein [Pontibacillus salipaludis]GGD28483.1 membrane protein [Pontibacillus salipaludis]